jgi:hypothetical protein
MAYNIKKFGTKVMISKLFVTKKKTATINLRTPIERHAAKLNKTKSQ